MRIPYDNFDKRFYVATKFGAKESYGYHPALDINLKTGGNTDYGEPVYAEHDGEITSVHLHGYSRNATFGNHYHLKVTGPWGVVYFHHAHLSEIFIKQGDRVKEGQLLAKIGNSGRPRGKMLAHDHWECKLRPTGIDSIARTKKDLLKWTDPIKFIAKWQEDSMAPDKDCEEKLLWYKKEFPLEQKRVVDARQERDEALQEATRLRDELSNLKEDCRVSVGAAEDESQLQKKRYQDLVKFLSDQLATTQDEPKLRAEVKRLLEIEDLYEKEVKSHSDTKEELIQQEKISSKLDEEIIRLKEELRVAKGLKDANGVELITELLRRLTRIRR